MGGWILGIVRATALAFSVVCLAAPSVRAAQIEGVEFADRYEWSGVQLRLNGVGLLRYRIFLKGYVAALYLGEEVGAERALADVPRRLEIEYFWSIPAGVFAKATRDGISRNVDPATVARIGDQIDQLNRLYEDVAPGDRYALTYVPGVGTELALNGESLGVVEGVDFSAALFAIWLGEQPLDEPLRDRLLAWR
jgi:hypothetical protein